eukprot:1625064-Alexandrium_andersonii.AAC.1
MSFISRPSIQNPHTRVARAIPDMYRLVQEVGHSRYRIGSRTDLMTQVGARMEIADMGKDEDDKGMDQDHDSDANTHKDRGCWEP